MFSSFGLTSDCTKDELTKKYKKFAKKYHPDKCGGDHSKFLKVREAYEICLEKLSLNDNVDFETMKNNFKNNIVEEEYKNDYDMGIFHKTFDKYVKSTPGYSFKNVEPSEVEILDKETSHEKFLSSFDKQKIKTRKKNEIQKYCNPEKIESCDANYENILDDNIKDFSSNHMYNKKKISFTDYYKAYTEYNVFEDFQEDEHKRNRTFDEMKNDMKEAKFNEEYSNFLSAQNALQANEEKDKINNFRMKMKDKHQQRLLIERDMFNQIS